MTPELFLLFLALVMGLLFRWAFRALPHERWQIMAALPVAKTESGEWRGVNLTYYGFFTASSSVVALLALLILLGSVGVSHLAVGAMGLALLGICWPAARIVARIVEKKAYTFTVGGAVFVGGLLAPWLIASWNLLTRGWENQSIPLLPTLAAMAVAYAYGESIGRLACISFGCCYGKRIEQLSPRWRHLFDGLAFVFTGQTKKAAYAGGLEGVPVVPIQAITAGIFALIALAGTYLYLRGWFRGALLLALAATQLWRFVSELFRDDDRGPASQVSAYQVMAILLIVYMFAVSIFFAGATPILPDLTRGLAALWHPAVLLVSQGLWALLFWQTGRSMVTGSRMTFFVHRERI